MAGLENPFTLTPASATQFVGRHDILERWRKRLTEGSDTWSKAQSWLVDGAGGVGKSSLLNKMAQVARDDFAANVISLDLGHFRQLDRDEDFFHYLDTALPPAKRWGSQVRRWFDLPANASRMQVTAKFLSLLSHFAVAFSHVNWSGLGLEFSPPAARSGQPLGFGQRLVEAFNTLSVLSEEQSRPVVLLIDQLGKVHDSYRWLLVGYELLYLAERIHDTKTANVICVFFLRPERKGLLEHELEYYLRRPLFKQQVLHVEHLHPFRRQEAIAAVMERSKGISGWGFSLAGKIANALNAAQDIDPYHVTLGASAVWERLYGPGGQREPDTLDDTAVYDIVHQGHSYLLDTVRHRSATQWEILSLLAFHPAGLTIDALTRKLNVQQKNLSLNEVEQGIAALSDQAGYRLLDAVSGSSQRYTLAHDILREWMLQALPAEQRRREQIQKVLDDGTWRYANGFSEAPFSRQDLDWVWQHQAELVYDPQTWQVVVASELQADETRLLLWLSARFDEVWPALEQCDVTNTATRSDFRCLLIMAVKQPTSRRLNLILLTVLSELAQKADNEYVRREAAAALRQIGEPALTVLIELAQTADSARVRVEAAAALGQMGEVDVSLAVLSELARKANNVFVVRTVVPAQVGKPGWAEHRELAEKLYDERVGVKAAAALKRVGKLGWAEHRELAKKFDDERVGMEAAAALRQVGEPALAVLSELAQKANNENVRREAVKALGQMGEPALAVLSELAQKADDEAVRVEVGAALGQMGEVDLSLAVLSKLVQKANNENVQVEAVKALGQMGEPALAVLSELAQKAGNEWQGEEAVKVLEQMGEPALAVLSELAQKADNEWLQWLAIKALGQMGEPALAVLSELAQKADSEDVRIMAAAALREMGEPAWAAHGELPQKANDEEVRREVTEALWRMRKPVFLPHSMLVQKGSNEWERWEAIKTLRRMGEPALAVLSELAQKSDNARVRMEAAAALGQMGKINVSLAVLGELAQKADDARIRVEAAAALGQMGEVDLSLAVLSEFAQKADTEWQRVEAVKALGQMGEPALEALLKIAWQGPGGQVPAFAGWALVGILKERSQELN